MRKYTMHVREFTAQATSLTSAPVPTDDYEHPSVDAAQNPTRVTVYTTTGTAAALRIAQRHLALVHARLAYTDPLAVDRTADDIVYAEARARAVALTPDQREDESHHTIYSEDDSLRMYALTDVMHELGEIDI
jgi:hypothetical protein